MQDLTTTILVVDDEMLIRTLARDALETAGYNVIEAADADEAIRKLERYDYISAIFTDIRMPGSMNGIEFASLVNDRWPQIGMLLTSGADNRPASAPLTRQFLAKPYTFADLVHRIRGMTS